jgi:hypothetical protein
VCGPSESRPTRSYCEKEIAKLERELRAIEVAIADFEHLEAKSSPKAKAIYTAKSGKEMRQRSDKRSRNSEVG